MLRHREWGWKAGGGEEEAGKKKPGGSNSREGRQSPMEPEAQLQAGSSGPGRQAGAGRACTRCTSNMRKQKMQVTHAPLTHTHTQGRQCARKGGLAARGRAPGYPAIFFLQQQRAEPARLHAGSKVGEPRRRRRSGGGLSRAAQLSLWRGSPS